MNDVAFYDISPSLERAVSSLSIVIYLNYPSFIPYSYTHSMVSQSHPYQAHE